MYIQPFGFYPTVLGLLYVIYQNLSFGKVPKRFKNREADKYQLLINGLIYCINDDYFLTPNGFSILKKLSESDCELYKNLI